MKSLILKDFYYILQNWKALIFSLIIFAVIFIPIQGPETYIIIAAVMSSTMIATPFALDEQSKWLKYAMILPITKKRYCKIKIYFYGITNTHRNNYRHYFFF